MSDKYFFDSNIWVYSLGRSELEKAELARAQIETARTRGSIVLSYQVIQEVLNIGFHKLQPRMTQREAESYVEGLISDCVVIPWSEQLVGRAIGVHSRYKFSWYDSLIVAAALEARCTTLYTEDLQHGQRIESLQIVNPFL